MASHIRQRHAAGTSVILLGIALVASSVSAQVNAPRSGQGAGQQTVYSNADRIRDSDRNWEAYQVRELDTFSERDKKADLARSKEAAREFINRLAEFTNAWNALMIIRDKGVWNAKKARQTHKAFERLVRSQGWVEHSKD